MVPLGFHAKVVTGKAAIPYTVTFYFEAPRACGSDSSIPRLLTRVTQFPGTDCGNTRGGGDSRLF
eukprot:897490-Pelagomonas_calceolata.AAC.1